MPWCSFGRGRWVAALNRTGLTEPLSAPNHSLELEDLPEVPPEGRRGHGRRLVRPRVRLHAVARAGPVRPRECRGETLATVIRVLQAGHGPAPGLGAEQGLQLRPSGVVQQQEVDLVAELMLDNAPRELPGVQKARVEPDLSEGRRGIDARCDVDRHA